MPRTRRRRRLVGLDPPVLLRRGLRASSPSSTASASATSSSPSSLRHSEKRTVLPLEANSGTSRGRGSFYRYIRCVHAVRDVYRAPRAAD